MQIAKKAALLAATAGTLVLLGTGTAAANGYGGSSERSTGVPTSFDIDSFIFQSNDCDTATGATTATAVGAPTGEINIGSTCINAIGG
ncbi:MULTISPECIES: hypothetical protein [unclassified Streptomyces]|uniref:hypothetical protein n=1 Tax=unclassified Streptomyces TaxID=2593676 RepID=UPI00168B347D|nr:MULTISPECIES: hypothetical protein [unclassified Streptomyces]MBD3002808.1 hypothetical protein [Streptomyces sp. 5-10]MBD3002809.1 hypothetical protein [Streptomyces sp. 5-10]